MCVHLSVCLCLHLCEYLCVCVYGCTCLCLCACGSVHVCILCVCVDVHLYFLCLCGCVGGGVCVEGLRCVLIGLYAGTEREVMFESGLTDLGQCGSIRLLGLRLTDWSMRGLSHN